MLIIGTILILFHQTLISITKGEFAMVRTSFPRVAFLLLLLIVAAASVSAQVNIRLDVDASDAFRNVVHVKETLDVRGGNVDLFYPKWIPGEHSPTGPIDDMVNFFVTADGKPLEWRRDDVEMFAFHVT